jgi:hypothetical protein
VGARSSAVSWPCLLLPLLNTRQRCRPLSPEVTISVHNYADVPTHLLAAAEDQARQIFRHSGLETVWLNCSPKLEKVEPRSCYFSDTTHLTLKISPHAMHAKVRDRIDVLGTAYPSEKGAGYFAYVFYDRVQEVAQRRSLGHALLADVMAHEIGHLLLGSPAHSASGIMCAHWSYEELWRSPKTLCRIEDHAGPAARSPE